VARTIADLEGSADVKQGHVVEAIRYRTLDRKLGAREAGGAVSAADPQVGQLFFQLLHPRVRDLAAAEVDRLEL
jgi:hypothetical protein